MVRWILFVLLGAALLAPGARAEDAEAQRLREWFARLCAQLAEIERRTGVLDAASQEPPAVPEGTGKSLASALLELTNRLQELETRVRALEKGAPVAVKPDGKPVEKGAKVPEPVAKGATNKETGAGGGAAAKEDTGGAQQPPYLSDAALVKRIPRPGKQSRVRFERGAGLPKGLVDLPATAGNSIFGKIPCQPGAELFLMSGAPIFGISLTVINDRRYLIQGEEFAHVRTGGRMILARMKVEATTEVTPEGPRFIETARFGLGLTDVLSLLERGGSVTIGDVTIEFVPECIALLSDLCSCLHPDRVEALIR